MNPPNEKTVGSLIPIPGTALTTFTRSEHIVSRMIEGALDIARRNAMPAITLHRIADFELREPDYRQVLRWAKSLQWSPEAVLDTLASYSPAYSKITFRLENGSIRELAWDGERMPLASFEWEVCLELEKLAIQGRMPKWTAEAALPSLRELNCFSCGLTELDLSPVPGLTQLDCGSNSLTELDLSPVPGLTQLDCGSNSLTELDLSPVPVLAKLECDDNPLTELDLSPVPRLTKLECGYIRLTELDLSPVPRLTKLECSDNQLTELDLSPVPRLTKLECSDNRLTELDLSPVPWLTELGCFTNQLTKLDLRPLDDSEIELWCDPGVHIIR